MSMTGTPSPSLGAVQRTLDALAAAARADDISSYRDALAEADRVALTDERVLDSYRWGRRGLGAADFDERGEPRG